MSNPSGINPAEKTSVPPLPQPTVSPVSSTTAQAVALPTPRLARGRLRHPRLTGYVLLAPSALFLLGFTYWPVLQVVGGSLTVRTFGGATHWAWGISPDCWPIRTSPAPSRTI